MQDHHFQDKWKPNNKIENKFYWMNKSPKVSHFWLTKAATYKTPAFHDKSFYVKKLILEQVWTFAHRTIQLLRCVWANNWIYQGEKNKRKKKEFTWDTWKSLNCVLVERYIIGAASSFQHWHPLHKIHKMKKAAEKGQIVRLNKNCQQNTVFS